MDLTLLLSSRARGARSSVIRDLLRLVDRPGMLSLAGGLPAPEMLPVARISAAAERVLSERSLQYAPTEGLAELRAAVAARLGCEAADVTITTGSQQGIDLLASVLVDPGDVVVAESPGYLGSLQSFEVAGARIVTIDGDEDGLRVDDLRVSLERGLRPKAVTVVSELANPTGATLSLDRRRALVELAVEFGFVVIDDNPYGELRWAGERLPPLAAFGIATDRIVTLGTASKILSPGLRVGWMRTPSWLSEAVVRRKQSADLHTSALDQSIVAEVLGDPAFMAAHLEQLRTTYRLRSAALTDALTDALGDRLDVAQPDGGMFVWARRRDHGSTTAWFERGLDAGVAFVPGEAFAPAGSANAGAGADCCRMCFATLSAADLGTAAARLASAW